MNTGDKELKNASDEELAIEADTGLRGQGAVVEISSRLKYAIEKLDKSIAMFHWILIGCTIVLVILTVVLVYFGRVQLQGLEKQIKESENSTSEQLTEDFNRDISTQTNTAIVAAI